jgi:hypothetical protein
MFAQTLRDGKPVPYITTTCVGAIHESPDKSVRNPHKIFPFIFLNNNVIFNM